LGKRKKVLHEKIGRAIEALHKENIDEHYEVLSDHFMKAENFEEGEEYCKLICKKAIKKGSFDDAITYGKKRLICLERLPKTDDVQKKIIDEQTILGLNLFQIGYFVESKEAVTTVIDLALKYDYKKRLCQLHTIEGSYYFWVKEDLPNAFKILKKAIRDSAEAGNYISLIIAYSILGNAMSLNCEFEKALENFQNASDIINKTKSKRGIAINKSHQSFFVFNFQGKKDLAYKTSSEGVQLAEDSGDILSKAMAYICHGRSCYHKRLLNDAEKYIVEGISFCKRINIFSWESIAQWTLGAIYYELGDYEKSKNCYLGSASLSNKNKFLPSFMNLSKIAAARSLVMNNEKNVDLETIYNYVSENKIKLYEGWMRRHLGEILLNIGDQHLTEAGKWIMQAIEADQRNGIMFFLAKDYALSIGIEN